jgi:hypothetical protein
MPATAANDENLFTIEAPQTRAGRSRRTRNLEELFVCECGSPVGKEDINKRANAIQCKKSDCETRWVSRVLVRCSMVTDPFIPVSLGLRWP